MADPIVVESRIIGQVVHIHLPWYGVRKPDGLWYTREVWITFDMGKEQWIIADKRGTSDGIVLATPDELLEIAKRNQ